MTAVRSLMPSRGVLMDVLVAVVHYLTMLNYLRRSLMHVLIDLMDLRSHKGFERVA